MGPESLSSAGAEVCRKAPKAFPDSSSALDQFQSASQAVLDRVPPAGLQVATLGVRKGALLTL